MRSKTLQRAIVSTLAVRIAFGRRGRFAPHGRRWRKREAPGSPFGFFRTARASGRTAPALPFGFSPSLFH